MAKGKWKVKGEKLFGPAGCVWEGSAIPLPALHRRKKQAVVKTACTDCVCSGVP